jgi:hypothetical protein
MPHFCEERERAELDLSFERFEVECCVRSVSLVWRGSSSCSSVKFTRDPDQDGLGCLCYVSTTLHNVISLRVPSMRGSFCQMLTWWIENKVVTANLTRVHRNNFPKHDLSVFHAYFLIRYSSTIIAISRYLLLLVSGRSWFTRYTNCRIQVWHFGSIWVQDNVSQIELQIPN